MVVLAADCRNPVAAGSLPSNGRDAAAGPPQMVATVPSLSTTFTWTLAGNAWSAGCQWMLLILLAKLGTAEMVGYFALATAVALPITLIAHLQLRSVFVTDLVGRYPLEEVLGLRVVLSVVALAGILIASEAAGYGPQATTVILLVGATQLVDAFSETYYGVCQRCERMDRIAKSLVLRSTLSLAVMAVAIYYTHDLVWGATTLVVARLGVLLCFDAAPATFALAGPGASLLDRGAAGPGLLARIRPHWNLRRQRELLWLALPLGGVSILVALSANIPRYVIERHMGPRELGIYSALNALPLAGGMVATALGNAAFARQARMFYTGDLVSFRSLTARILGICFALGVAGFLAVVAVGKQALGILYRPEYAEKSELLLYLMAAAAVAYLAACLGCAMTAAAQFRPQVPLCLAVIVASAVSSVLLIPRYGLYGAALAGLISTLVQLLGTAIIIHRAMAARGRAGPAVPRGVGPT